MKAVVVCPGRGTYGKGELGSLLRHHAGKADLLASYESVRAEAGQESLADLDGAARFDMARHTRGDNASALIHAMTVADTMDLAGVEVVAVTGNSMGWYSALAVAGALAPVEGFRLANGMGARMQAALIGGQLVYPHMGDDWRPDPARKAELLALVADIGARPGHAFALSIDLGGMLVLAGNEAGLAAFEAAVPKAGQFPLRLPNHAAFHTGLQAPVAAEGRAAFLGLPWQQPALPMIDGRGEIWWPRSADLGRLADYTLGHQVVAAYEFTHAIAVAAREFAPDVFIVTGPGTTLGGAVAQSLVLAGWRGMTSKDDFMARQAEQPILVSMGREDQRGLVTG
ncbi:Malonyl CoA-acyl carrier protein transacylase [Gemmobacter megaterium]|uniref:[acyl-carrier-protein] S-malonyltransferase n=1 Tax=Gemmobacter megaterium TaxID=1086013 RepID=A0A1N7K153_9RHOB|nr:acyl carrier protein [Gemmobacter megaterium]GGD99895.1 acyl carrier protein [Gemmobacter megaterium]SIS55319.1 Malonyl CoA-acyl carrier protein transacylase [Gemmobacter megaterium]